MEKLASQPYWSPSDSNKRNCTNKLKYTVLKHFICVMFNNYLIMALKGIHIIDNRIQDDALASDLDT
jgi:hypothetical protein